MTIQKQPYTSGNDQGNTHSAIISPLKANGYMQGPYRTSALPEMGYQYKFTPREIYRFGIADLNLICQQRQQKVFAQLTPEQQTKILSQLESGNLALTNVPGQVFFKQLLTNTKEGFFADPIYGGNKDMVGWKMLGFPGANPDYREFILQYNQPYNKGPFSIESYRG